MIKVVCFSSPLPYLLRCQELCYTHVWPALQGLYQLPWKKNWFGTLGDEGGEVIKGGDDLDLYKFSTYIFLRFQVNIGFIHNEMSADVRCQTWDLSRFYARNLTLQVL